ncbi:Imm70 family immunity protein [Janthinobacterium sp. PAMC25594]|uniref:Imm70 family immunity protein n=1 Tax=Janthinobacterium sp. PAMC25594 TaxID=2861284 RepID=UPI001C6290F2|nr:Imm70 family immunity protein [Janthinobacterium sp. PAMC25594]QYG08027.1 immunity 70 family protein [Janthinobacterium sp. PAMC25594]
MGLYLCVFDGDEELEGVEVGSYADFNFFRDAVAATVETGTVGTVCPVLNTHSDSDGEWTSQEAERLLAELMQIAEVLCCYPPVEFNSEWKKEVAKTFGLCPQTLLDCFFDIDGESLVARLKQLAQISISSGQPILFQ